MFKFTDLLRQQAARGCPFCTLATPTGFMASAEVDIEEQKKALASRQDQLDRYTKMDEQQLEREEILETEAALKELLAEVERIKADKGIE